MSCRRALGALLTIFILAPLPALCTVCPTDLCPMWTEGAPSHDAMVRDTMTHHATAMGSLKQGRCCEAPDTPCAEARLEAVAPDCCGGAANATAEAPAMPAPALASLALAPAMHHAVPSPIPAPSFELRGGEAPPPTAHVPLFTLHSSLLI